jgi:hypothetical protein
MQVAGRVSAHGSLDGGDVDALVLGFAPPHDHVDDGLGELPRDLSNGGKEVIEGRVDALGEYTGKVEVVILQVHKSDRVDPVHEATVARTHGRPSASPIFLSATSIKFSRT